MNPRRRCTAAALLLGSTLIGGCGGLHGPGGRSSGGACVAAVPVGQQTAGSGRLRDVRRLTVREINGLLHRDTQPPLAARYPQSLRLCLLVYAGSFRLADFPATAGGSSGPATAPYVLLVLTGRHPELVRVALTAKVPPGLRH